MRLHLGLTLAWVIIGGYWTYTHPTSIAWLAFMSLYANIVGHWSAYQAVRAEKTVEAGSSSPV